tara:strand:+ start:503 stop:3016 length:2514 start_codon:yes stop_codon:yes gene_type:complete
VQITFLEATNGLRLSKLYKKDNTFTPYPHVKAVTSHHYNIPTSKDGLTELKDLIIQHGDKGHCMLKGPLKRPVINESRAGLADRAAYTSLLVLDIDGITLSNYNPKKSNLTKVDVEFMAEQIIMSLPTEMQDISYIAQASSSLGLKQTKVSLHIFMFLAVPMPAKSVKLWLQHVNYTSELFSSQLELSSNSHALKYPLDTSVADNSKIIFIAPPTFDEATSDPFSPQLERVVLVERSASSINLAAMMSSISPEVCFQKGQELKNELRQAIGFRKTKANVQIATVDNKPEEILTNPDKMSITIADESSTPYIRCNINGGDSNAYFFNINNPTYMYNFKDEPIFEIEKADKDFYLSIFDTYEKEIKEAGRAVQPIVLRDYYTDTYYNGLFDPNLNQFTESYPLIPTSKTSIEGFMRSHGRTNPAFIPDARVVFDPTDKSPAVNLNTAPYYVNMYRKTKYMLAAKETQKYGVGTAKNMAEHCPLTYKLISHILGGGELEFEYFINWLAYVYQNKTKAMTAWILTGVPGTGKGIFYSHILKPLFGDEHVPMRSLQNIEEQFNLYMRSALFLIVDEFRMADASSGTMKMADKLKNQITEKTLAIRAMRSNQHELPSYTNFIFLTNRPDAVKIEDGDRRYNVAPRQEKKLEHVYPEVIEHIEDLEQELLLFAGVLQEFKVQNKLVRTCMNNDAKATMKTVGMSVFEEFCAAIKDGNIGFFADALELSISNTFNASDVMTAQRVIKNWVKESQEAYSIIPMEHLRTVFHVQTEHTPKLSQREFSKRIERNGIKRTRKRPVGADRSTTAIQGVEVSWNIDQEQYDYLLDSYFTEKDSKLLETMTH